MASRLTVFRNGGIFDGRRYRGPGSVVVRDGRVAAVGGPEEARAYADGSGPAVVQEVDLAGGLLLPGFQDAHVHPVQGGLERMRCDLSAMSTREEYLSAIRAYAEAHPELDWLCGGGWSMSAFGPAGPTAADLDSVVPDRPVFLPNRDHHGAWVNSRALERCGIDERTPDPVDGRLERDAAGRPTGSLHEGAMSLVESRIPRTSREEYAEALLVGQRYLHSLGITAWQDAILGDYAGIDDPSQTYLDAVGAGVLTGRVRGALWWDRARGLEQLPELEERRDRLTAGRLVAGAVKIMLDGVAENYTAAMTEPYLDGGGCRTHNRGLSFVDAAALREAVRALDSAAFQVHVHAIGDRAIREALDAVEVARKANGSNDLRHHIAHLQLVHPDDRPRFAALGVVANMQPLWAHLDDQMVELTLPYLSEERAGWQYPFADLARCGARLAAGSDWPVSTPDPVQGIHVAVNRWAHGEPGRAGSEPFLPEQRLTLEQAFAAYTSGSAFVNHLDDSGRLEVGAVADLAVLDRDPFSGPAEEVGRAAVRATYVDGVPVFGA